MSQAKYKVHIPPAKVEELKEKYGLSDEALSEVASGLEVQGEAEEEFTPSFVRSLAKGNSELGVTESILLLDFLDRREERQWRREQQGHSKPNTPSPEVEGLKGEISNLRESVGGLVKKLETQEAQEIQEAFAEGVVKNVNSQIRPELQSLGKRVEVIEQRSQQTPIQENLGTELKTAIDNLGEKIATKAASQKITMDDLNPLLDLLDRIEKRTKKGEPPGEFDWRTLSINTAGELGKELITTFRDIEKSKTSMGFQPGAPGTPAPQTPMRGIIKSQVQGFIMQRLTAGATQLNLHEAAQQLGLTPQQVFQAYNDLQAEGWFQTMHAGGGKKPGSEQSATTESDQVFA